MRTKLRLEWVMDYILADILKDNSEAKVQKFAHNEDDCLKLKWDLYFPSSKKKNGFLYDLSRNKAYSLLKELGLSYYEASDTTGMILFTWDSDDISTAIETSEALVKGFRELYGLEVEGSVVGDSKILQSNWYWGELD